MNRARTVRRRAIRAVYGQWFPWLLFLDKNWATTNVPLIFPKDKDSEERRDVAWYTYIIFCQPYDEVFDILRDEYATAIQRINSPSAWKPAYGNPDHRLADHLMALYWRGKLDLGVSGLLLDFLERAPRKLAGYAIGFIGRSLKNTKEEIAPRIVDRLRTLWELRLEIAKSADRAQSHHLELAAFGRWFTSGKFDRDWAARQLQDALEIAGDIDDDHEVVEQLARLSSSDPIRAITCLNLLVKEPKEPWRIFAYQDGARKIVATAIASGSSVARELAEDTIQRLMAQGHMNFRELLPSPLVG
jgi:hypothetical protein